MNIKSTYLVIGAISAVSSGSAVALVFGGTNFSFSGYPDHECRRPYSKPIKPYKFTNQWEIDNYNNEVDRFNDELESFTKCIIEYVDNGDNDIKRVKEKAQAAIDEARRPIY